MTNYFECRVSYDKTLESGAIKQVTESYLVEAMSFTDSRMQPALSRQMTMETEVGMFRF